MYKHSGNWLFYKWWYLIAIFASAALLVAGLFGIVPLFLIGLLGGITCFIAYHRLNQDKKFYGISLKKIRFRQWWWWIAAALSLMTLSANDTLFLYGLFFFLLALMLLFMPHKR